MKHLALAVYLPVLLALLLVALLARVVRWAMKPSFRTELEALINRHSKENGSDTPDFILADYLMHCLIAFDTATLARDKWYGYKGLVSRTSIPLDADNDAAEPQ